MPNLFVSDVFVSDEGGDTGGGTVVMLHGLGGTTSMYQPQATALSTDHRVVRIDLPGAGRSPATGPLSIADWADAVVRVLDPLGIERATFVVHSLGTLVAVDLADRHPSYVDAVVALGPVRSQPEPVKAATRERAALVRREGMGAVVEGVLGVAVSERALREQPVVPAFVRESLLGQDPEGYADSCDALAAAEEPRWSALSVPTWLVSGDDDKLAAPELVAGVAEKLPHAARRTLPGAGHWLSVEEPDAVTAVIREAVAS